VAGWLARIDQHPLFATALLHGWLAGGSGEGWVRAFSALCSVATIPLFDAAVRLLQGPQTAQVAALILAVAPFHVRYAQEARMYRVAELAGRGRAPLSSPAGAPQTRRAQAACRATGSLGRLCAVQRGHLADPQHRSALPAGAQFLLCQLVGVGTVPETAAPTGESSSSARHSFLGAWPKEPSFALAALGRPLLCSRARESSNSSGSLPLRQRACCRRCKT
jgi:hypothetical protein